VTDSASYFLPSLWRWRRRRQNQGGGGGGGGCGWASGPFSRISTQKEVCTWIFCSS